MLKTLVQNTIGNKKGIVLLVLMFSKVLKFKFNQNRLIVLDGNRITDKDLGVRELVTLRNDREI